MLSLQFHPFPTLLTNRLCLRRIGLEDQEAFFSLRSSSTVMKYIDRPLAKTVDEVKKLIGTMSDLIDANEGLTWTITLKENPRMIGTVHLWKISREDCRAEIGYLLDPIYQGRGIMQESLQAVTRHAFGEIGLHSLEARVSPENAASIRLLERCGFRMEAHFRENYFYDGKFQDTMIFSLLTTDADNPAPAASGRS